MKPVTLFFITALLAAGASYVQSAEQPPPEPSQEQPEALTSGPVHESFAEPVEIQNETGVTAPNEPPPEITENIPNEKPDGKQYVWVPGYWAWDAQRNGYIWVSGCWRAAPPERYWVPGYWYQTSDGWEWVPGFWASSPDEQQIEYLPAPPPVSDIEAPGPPPISNDIWIPPCWYWRQDNYVLRPGYWLTPYDDWIWIPSHYTWTPRGYVFIGGYWDYSLSRRGILFAPYYIPRPLYLRPGFSLSLGVVLDLGVLELNLFTYPRYCHYYFGDYYSDIYIGLGIYPQFEWRTYHTWYDPLYVHSRWRHHETEQAWYDHERHEYDLRRNDAALRPTRTYRDMQRRLAMIPESQRKDYRMAQPMRGFIDSSKKTMKFQRLNTGSRQKYLAKAQDVHQFSQQRRNWESAPSANRTNQQPSESRTRATQLPEHRQPMTEPTMQRRTTESPTMQRQTAQAPSERRSYEERMQSNRGTHIRQPEQARIPSPPIVGRRNSRGFFGMGGRITPSHPNNERMYGGERSRGSGGFGRRGRH